MTVKITKPSRVHIRTHNDSSIHPLKEENSRLRTDISRLRIEKARLREDNSQLKAENLQLKAENARLKTENTLLEEDLFFVHEELQAERELSELKDIELAKNDALYHMLEDEHLRLHLD